MKEYKIVCTIDQFDGYGKKYHYETSSPILSGSNRMRSITTDRKEAERLLAEAERKGKEFEEWTRDMAETYKDTFVTTQSNYRIMSREVTEWVEA